MKINELSMNADNVFCNIQCRMVIDRKIISRSGRVEMVGDNLFKFINKDNVIDFKVADRNDAKLIMDAFNRHYFCLAYVTAYNSDKTIFFIHMGLFYNLQRWGKTPVIISNEIKEKIREYMRSGQDIEKFLTDNFMLSDGVCSYFAYTSGKFYYGEQNNENDEKEKIKGVDSSQSVLNKDLGIEAIIHAEDKEKQIKSSLVIYGKEFCAYLTVLGENFDSKLYVEKIAVKRNNIPMMRISEGSLEFFDHRSVISKKVKETLENTKGYLDLWNQYADQEGMLLLEKVRSVGLINIRRDEITFGTAITVPYHGLSKKAEELITDDSYLFFSENIPMYLADEQMTWSDYRAMSKEASDIEYSSNKGVQVRVVTKKNGEFILDAEGSESSSEWQEKLRDLKYVSLSILGDERQISRREDARNRIATGNAANPALGLILEGKLSEELGSLSTRKKIPPLSAFVKEKIFQHEPTETQKRAIEIALNTPDIAIIQGPPGTGKTTVITAIIERLNELCDKREKINGQVLITSFQHDAVRNVIERLKINSLPTIKFGKQKKEGEEDLTRERVVEEWCKDYINKLSEKNPELIETEQRNKLSKLHNMYIAYPSDNNALHFLHCAKQVNTDAELDKNISRLIESKNVSLDEDSSHLVTLIRRIRTTKEGFADDGAENADILIEALEEYGIDRKIPGNDTAMDILDQAAKCFDREPDQQLLAELKEVKKNLLEKCIPRPSYRRDVIDSEITAVYNRLNMSVKKHKDEKSAILAELMNELTINRSEVEKSLERYLFVYAATTQQSEGNEIKKAKGIKTSSDDHPEYETVIVDEAARVSPLDLMIPLAQAKKRIILVGDHRQLPHIYNEEVFESMKENGENIDINNIRKSMFEYLLEKARELEKTDHIQRTIVLDAQYRMHPMLGEFIDEVFYKPNNEHFASPLPAANYAQHISKKAYPVEWYDFPDNCGSEKKEGTSRVRECEADFIVDKISTFINSEEGKSLSYGVITFYSEQVKLIKGKLKNKLGESSDKIRVGSVDAFQGMEFDVIFLSIVRSSSNVPMVRTEKDGKPQKIDFDKLNRNISKSDNDETAYNEWSIYWEKVGIQNYGFLISENRLCVSLSRQKKLLIVVGNSMMFGDGEWGRIAEICVPGMRKLYELCKREDVIYDGRSESIQSL